MRPELGIEVYRPIGEGGRCDMILEVGARPDARPVQMGAARRRRGLRALLLGAPNSHRLCSDERRCTVRRLMRSRHIAPELDSCYFFRWASSTVETMFLLRVRPTRNNQGRGVNWAESYGSRLDWSRVGAVAQLGERQPWHGGGHGFDPRRLHLRPAAPLRFGPCGSPLRERDGRELAESALEELSDALGRRRAAGRDGRAVCGARDAPELGIRVRGGESLGIGGQDDVVRRPVDEQDGAP